MRPRGPPALRLYGAATHLTDLVRHGLSPYDWAPRGLNLYWSSLAVLDPLVAALLLGGRRWGVALTCAVATTDLAANWYAVHVVQHGDAVHHPGVQRLAAFTLLALATARTCTAAWRHRRTRLVEHVCTALWSGTHVSQP